MKSSYSKNNFGEVIYNTVLAFPPAIAVELGVLEGFSTVAIARALSDLESGHLFSYDLWENYPYNHSTMKFVQLKINEFKLSKFVTLKKKDAYLVSEDYADDSVELLHIDISNDGDVLNRMLELWTPKIRNRGIILFEGGSEERDNVDWMIKYNKKPILPEMNKNKILNENYIYGTYQMFPSLTIMKKVT